MIKDEYWARIKNVPSTLQPHPDLAALAAQGADICDVGCGRGTLFARLSGPGLRCGIDINAGALAAAAAETPGAAFACAELASLPFPDKAFQAACMQAVMTLLASPRERRRALREIRRVADRLFISDFLLTPEDPYYNARYERGQEETGEYGSFVVREDGRTLYTAHHYAREELAALLEECGFTVNSLFEGKVRTRSGNIINGVRIAARRA